MERTTATQRCTDSESSDWMYRDTFFDMEFHLNLSFIRRNWTNVTDVSLDRCFHVIEIRLSDLPAKCGPIRLCLHGQA